MEHIAIPIGEIHIPHNWEYADATERGAAVINDAGALECIALQLDDGTYWRLSAVGPTTWTAVAAVPTPHSHAISDVTGLDSALESKAASSHNHAISEVTGLQGALDGKAASSHSHAISDVTGLQGALDGKTTTTYVDNAVTTALGDIAAALTAINGA